MNKVFIDCGANVGSVLMDFMAEFPDHDFHAFEPNPALVPLIHARVASLLPLAPRIHSKAVWVRDGETDLYLGHPDSSTLLPGKQVPECYTQQIDYSHPVRVPCIDFSRWLAQNVSPGDEVKVKMDIEGAEYIVLERMLAQGTLGLISRLQVEWHFDRFPQISVEQHRTLVSAVERQTQLLPWD
jgi:FkbM family methyltransferase